jgi:hypothetical protein
MNVVNRDKAETVKPLSNIALLSLLSFALPTQLIPKTKHSIDKMI